MVVGTAGAPVGAEIGPWRASDRAVRPDRGAEIRIGPNRIGEAIGNTVDVRAFSEG